MTDCAHLRRSHARAPPSPLAGEGGRRSRPDEGESSEARRAAGRLGAGGGAFKRWNVQPALVRRPTSASSTQRARFARSPHPAGFAGRLPPQGGKVLPRLLRTPGAMGRLTTPTDCALSAAPERALNLLPLREKVAGEAGRMRGSRAKRRHAAGDWAVRMTSRRWSSQPHIRPPPTRASSTQRARFARSPHPAGFPRKGGRYAAAFRSALRWATVQR
jgi:hypothetical protein